MDSLTSNLLVNLDAGITGAVVREDWSGRSETVGILVKDDRAFILDELEDMSALNTIWLVHYMNTLHSLKTR